MRRNQFPFAETVNDLQSFSIHDRDAVGEFVRNEQTPVRPDFDVVRIGKNRLTCLVERREGTGPKLPCALASVTGTSRAITTFDTNGTEPMGILPMAEVYACQFRLGNQHLVSRLGDRDDAMRRCRPPMARFVLPVSGRPVSGTSIQQDLNSQRINC